MALLSSSPSPLVKIRQECAREQALWKIPMGSTTTPFLDMSCDVDRLYQEWR